MNVCSNVHIVYLVRHNVVMSWCSRQQ